MLLRNCLHTHTLTYTQIHTHTHKGRSMLTRAHHQRIIRACIYLPTLSAQKLEISESESVEANMEAEAGLTLGVLAVVAKTPSVFGTHMGSAMSMMEALGSNELGGVMDFLFSMSLYNRHREIKSVFAFYVHITGVAVDTILGRGGEGGEGGEEGEGGR